MARNLYDTAEGARSHFSDFYAETLRLLRVKGYFISIAMIVPFMSLVVMTFVLIMTFVLLAFVPVMVVMVCEFVLGIGIAGCNDCT